MVIAKNDAKIKRLEKCEKWMKDHFFCEEIASFKVRHQKYKRCLAMAEWCDAEADVSDADGDYEDMRWYQKWHQKWLELADKFKEDK